MASATSRTMLATAVAGTAPSVHKLDGATVDRLADDIIRRIDKRMRVERERRGI